MIRGVSFKIKQHDNGKVLSRIFQSIDVKKYNWYNILDQNEVWANFQGEEILDEEYYAGNAFEELMDSEHYIIFLKLQAYFEKAECQNLFTYEEFMEDDCQLLLLISDSEYVEIYIKESDLASNIYSMAEKNGFSNVEYITDDNDSRMEFKIL